MDPTVVGVLGVGSLGFHHARLLREIPEARLAGIYDINAEQALSVSSQLDTRAYENPDELLEEVDAVCIAVPTSSHYEVGKTALDRGCDLLIEKPIATNTTQADELIALARQNDRIIQVGHVERFNDAVRACEPYLENPLFVESHRMAPYARRGTDVSVVLDVMIHDIDLLLSLVPGSVVDVRAAGVPVVSPKVDIANARIEFDSGAVANITASRVSIRRQRKIRFFQRNGYISLDLGKGTGEFYRRKATTTPPDEIRDLGDLVEHIHLRGDGAEPLRLELQAFTRAVRREQPVAVSAEDARTALAIALDIVERIERHQEYVLDSNPA